MAYARWDGLGLIAPQLEAFLRGGGEFQSVYGVSNGVTTPDSFLYSLYLQELFKTHTYAGSIEDKFANATFHPKFFEFCFTDRIVAVIGSANLTGGGFVRNFELGAEFEVELGSETAKQLDGAWKLIRKASLPVTISRIRSLTSNNELGSEKQNESSSGKTDKPFFRSGVKTSPKPLFAKVLDLKKPTTKSKILSNLDSLTIKPKRLYLQIFPVETGGHGKVQGYQIQLPTSTLATYFGVSPKSHRSAVFHFGKERIETTFTHFPNDTHRLRLRPILDVDRPAILIFDRVGPDEYKCTFVPKSAYTAKLSSKCTEQRRSGARRWGIE